ncbi:MAG: M67 family metallopeptidase [Acidobacteria bacterium]|nr:M67 family metallopeptidase [Acidobacteriota bacterium]
MTPQIRRHVWQEMLEHARREYPLECCGLLAGEQEVAESITPATNQLASPNSFSVPAEELFQFFRRLVDSPQRLIGIYHSHPNAPATPSPRDTAEFHYHDVFYWIVSLKDLQPDIRCFRWGRMGFEEIKYVILD